MTKSTKALIVLEDKVRTYCRNLVCLRTPDIPLHNRNQQWVQSGNRNVSRKCMEMQMLLDLRITQKDVLSQMKNMTSRKLNLQFK